MQNILFVLSLLLLGVLLRRSGKFPADTAKSLSSFVIWVSLPALILREIPGLEFSSELLILVAMPWGTLAVSAALILVLAKVFRWSRSITGCLLLVVPLGSTDELERIEPIPASGYDRYGDV